MPSLSDLYFEKANSLLIKAREKNQPVISKIAPLIGASIAEGGINSLWPIFGVGNQLLAVIALAFGTTILIKMKRIRYLWVTLAPLGWLLSVTFSAGLIKIFSNNPKLGFLSAAHNFQSQLAAATNQQTLSFLKQQILNNYIDACVTGVFLALVVIVVIANARVWIKLLLNPEQIKLNEDPYVPVAVNTV